jgi:tetratricopeptide (TPR) repeat protein
MLYGEQKKYDLAIPELKEVFERRKKILKKDDPATLQTLTDLSLAFFNYGSKLAQEEGQSEKVRQQYKQAQSLCEELVAANKRTLGADHLKTIQAMSNLGATCSALGEYKKAEQLYKHVWETRQRVLGENHLDTQDVKESLRRCQEEEEKAAAAKALMSMHSA